MTPLVETEADAVPIVRILAALARRALRGPSLARQVAKLGGVVAVQSATDPQAATLRFGGDTIRVERGIASDADVTITVDLADPSAKPKVSGAVRHPALTLAVAKLLEPPVGDWQDEAERFCTAALRSPGCPRPLRIVCTDDGVTRQWGGDAEPAIEIHGPASQLAAALSGTSVLVEDVLEERLAVVGDLRGISMMTRFVIDHLFGELCTPT